MAIRSADDDLHPPVLRLAHPWPGWNQQVRITETPSGDYSEVGQGTTVCLYLPRYHGEAGDVSVPTETAQVSPRCEAGETVLVVDDEPTVRMLVVEVLEELNVPGLAIRHGLTAEDIKQTMFAYPTAASDIG